MAKRKPKKGNDIPEWVLTYGDMMSLLLCFFILLAAFSELKKPDEYQRVIDAIQEALGVSGGDSSILDSLDLSKADVTEHSAFKPNQRDNPSSSDTNDRSVPGPDSTASKLVTDDKWTIGQPIPFPASSDLIDEQTKTVLREELAPKVRGSDYKFLVVGHAWGPQDRVGGLTLDELSFRRAQAVKDYLVQECEVEAMSLSVLVASDGIPLSRDDQGASGVEGNRRVEIFQTSMTLDKLHPDPNFTGRQN